MTHAEQAKHVADGAAIAVTIASVAAWLPPIAALVTIIWTLIRIYETETVQRMLGRKPKDTPSDQ